MQQGFIKCAVATPRITVADCNQNAKAILETVDRAEKDGAKILVLPELSLTGYTCGELFHLSRLQKAAVEGLSSIAKATENRDMLLVLGLPLSVKGALYNAAAVLHRGKILGIVPKTHLPNYGEFFEKRYFSPAPAETCTLDLLGQQVPFGSRLLFACNTLPQLILGVEICEDLWAPVPPSTGLALAGATVIANLSASPEAAGKAVYRKNLVSSHSARITAGYLYASAGEGESTTDLVCSGHNMISEAGQLLAEAAPFGEGYALSEIDLDYLIRERQRLVKPLEAEGYATVPFTLDLEETTLTRTYSKTPFVPEKRAQARERAEELLEIQAQGLKKRLAHTGCKAVLGISGGADSTMALLVCLRALELLGRPKTDLIPVTMPCFGTSHRTRSNAERLCELLGVPCRVIDITAAVTQHLKDLNHPLDVPDTAFENAQARERTQVLMDLANMENALVIGTGDLSELALGFATYNGDHMSMYGVNAGLPKTAIRSMLTLLAPRYGDGAEKVLLDVVATPVSPELLPATDGVSPQITEEVVGPYELTDFFLYHLLRRGAEPAKILRLARYAFKKEYEEAVIEGWLKGFLRRFFTQQFKRSCLPDGPKVGSVCLSPRGGWMMPSDAAYSHWRL